MKIFILWVALSTPHGVTLESKEYESQDACNKAEMVLHQKFTVAADWNTLPVAVMTSCTEK